MLNFGYSPTGIYSSQYSYVYLVGVARLLNVMRRDDACDPALRQGPEVLPDSGGYRVVQACRGLIQDEEAGGVHHCDRH